MGKKNSRYTIVPRTKCVLNRYLCMLCLWGSRFIFPLPSLNPKHLLGKENSVAIVNFLSARIDWDRFTWQPRSTGTFKLSSSWHSGHFTLLNICLALSHQLHGKGKMTVPCKTGLHQFQIATCLLVLQSGAQIHFSPSVPWCNIFSELQGSHSLWLTVPTPRPIPF